LKAGGGTGHPTRDVVLANPKNTDNSERAAQKAPAWEVFAVSAAQRRPLVVSLVIVLLGACGLVVVGAGTSSGAPAPQVKSCDRLNDYTGPPGAFTASSTGHGEGPASFDPGNAPSVESQGHLAWNLALTVTGNQTPGPNTPGAMKGSLRFTYTPQEGRSITFTAKCIQEAGVFNSVETEDDPFGDETSRVVKRGVEAEFEGTATNFPANGQTTHVVAAFASWTGQGASSPRFKLDMVTGTCATEAAPGLSMGGPKPDVGDATVQAPDMQASRSNCGRIDQQEQA
jgi:hypothetical protein